jgi:uncharacterized protein
MPVFKPAGVPTAMLDRVSMTLDEFEAIRLADLEQLHQDQAARQMDVSRPTFSRILDAAHRKLADALVHGKALRIEGGNVQTRPGPRRCCRLHDGAGAESVGPPSITPDPSQETLT